jgi:hypothetical protein
MYNCILLFDPSTFTQRDAQLFAALKKAGLDAIRAKFGATAVKNESTPVLASDIRWPILDAAEKADKWAGFQPGRLFVRVKSQYRPGTGKVILGDDGRPKPIEVGPEAKDLFYPGAIVRAKVSPWAYLNKTKGVRFTLENLLFLADGERLVQERSVADKYGEEDFADYASQLSDDSDGLA